MASSNQTLSCETCNSTFNSRDELKQHSMKEHEGKATNTTIMTNSEPTFMCEMCDAIFNSLEELRQHSIKDHESKR
jgi:uncharacterized C2H2 Zn-finger protein